MTSVLVTESEQEYVDKYCAYWLFCLKRRYSGSFLVILISGAVAASLCLVLANPESIGFSFLSALLVVLGLVAVVAVFDMFRYEKYRNQIIAYYREHGESLTYELKFDTGKIYFGEGEKDSIAWNFYRFYHSDKDYVYLFDQKKSLKVIMSEQMLGTEAFESFINCAKANLKLLK